MLILNDQELLVYDHTYDSEYQCLVLSLDCQMAVLTYYLTYTQKQCQGMTMHTQLSMSIILYLMHMYEL
jgi:hypothetical protein